jgi:integrase
MFSDDDFQTLCTAFDDCDYPKFIEPDQRSRYWYTLIHFAAVTALRREAILGMNIDAVNFNEHFVTVDKTIDKKEKVRYKPITPELAADILNLRRFYDNSQMVPALRKRIFPWTHGNKRWYICWNAAEQKLGKRFHMHDIKRFSGELVLRAGATPLELQQHMDHANIATTLLHYCRPQTTNLIRRIRVPLPDKRPKMTPLFTEPELRETIESILVDRLQNAGIDVKELLLSLNEYGEVDFKNFSMPGMKDSKTPKSDQRTFREQRKTAKAAKQGLRVFWNDEEGGDA